MSIPDSGWQHHFVETNDIRLHCVTQGEGELVILLHGFPEFWYSWRHQIPALGRYFKVVVPDLRGYNYSDKPASGYDLDTLSADIRGLIERFGKTRAHIVGHDWGGVIAWHLAQKFPECIDRLAILNAPHPQQFVKDLIGNIDQLRRSWFLLLFQIPALPEWLIQHNLKNFVQNLFREHAIRKAAFTTEVMNIYQNALAKPRVLTAAINYYRQILSPQTWLNNREEHTKLVTAPTLVLWGEEDSFLSNKLTQDLDKLIAAPFQLKFVPNCGHWIQQEAPDTVNRELLKFLRSSEKLWSRKAKLP